MSLTTAKMSVAFLILRLVGPSTFWRKWLLYTSIGLTFIIGTLASILTFVQCNPPRALWEGPQNVTGAKCWNPKSQSDFAIFTGSRFEITNFSLAIMLTPHSLLYNHRLLPCPPSHHICLELEPETSKKGCLEHLIEFRCLVREAQKPSY